jgi:hypothetical protein
MRGSRWRLVAAAPLALATAAACAAAAVGDERALRVVERTKMFDGSYASYTWNRISPTGQPPVEEWSAEFHSGALHRVETPRDRIVADCSALSGTWLSLVTGETVTNSQVAASACGINTNKPFRSARLRGRVEGPFGIVDRVEVADHENVRVYDVTREGVIVRATYADRETPQILALESWTVALDSELPADDLFSEQSLQRSFVPAQHQSPPTAD